MSVINSNRMPIEEDISKENSFEINILKRILGFSILCTTPYIFFTLFIQYNYHELLQTLIVFGIFSLLFTWLFFPGLNSLKKHIITNVLIFSVVSGFFVLGGVKGIAAFDLVNTIFFVTLIYIGKERNFYLVYLAIIITVLLIINLTWPENISDHSKNDPLYFTILITIIRFFLSLNLGLSLRDAILKENKKVYKLLEEIKVLNREVSRHNHELKSISKQLLFSNESLEEKIEERTENLRKSNQKLLVYSYINSHIFRAPLARIKGILHLSRIMKKDGDRQELDDLLYKEIDDIDKLTHKISDLINERENSEFEEIVRQAEKIYQISDLPSAGSFIKQTN